MAEVVRCSQCQVKFPTLVALDEHMRVHPSRPPYHCLVETCKKTYQSRGALSVHIRSHSNTRPFHCTECSKDFLTKATLLLHVRTHSGEKPYKCKYCGFGYSQNCNLKAHERRHCDGKLATPCTQTRATEPVRGVSPEGETSPGPCPNLVPLVPCASPVSASIAEGSQCCPPPAPLEADQHFPPFVAAMLPRLDDVQEDFNPGCTFPQDAPMPNFSHNFLNTNFSVQFGHGTTDAEGYTTALASDTSLLGLASLSGTEFV